jgi:hypothetical protein
VDVDVDATVDVVDVWVDPPTGAVVVVVDVPDALSSNGFSVLRSSSFLSPLPSTRPPDPSGGLSNEAIIGSCIVESFPSFRDDDDSLPLPPRSSSFGALAVDSRRPTIAAFKSCGHMVLLTYGDT